MLSPEDKIHFLDPISFQTKRTQNLLNNPFNKMSVSGVTYHVKSDVSVTHGSEFPLTRLYRQQQADAIQTLGVLQLC